MYYSTPESRGIGANPDAMCTDSDSLAQIPRHGTDPELIGTDPEAVGTDPGAVGMNTEAAGMDPGAMTQSSRRARRAG